MLKYIDRLLVISYFKAYVICLVSLLSLYVVVDLFNNIDNFTQHHPGLQAVLIHIGTYYGRQITRIFDQLSEPIVLLAATFTVAWMQRSNELLPLLSPRVPTPRVVAPVLCTAFGMLSLAILNQELIIPDLAPELMIQKDDPEGKRDLGIQATYLSNGVHLEGLFGNRKEQVIRPLYCTIMPGMEGRNLVHLNAQEARYVAPDPGNPRRTGGWLLTDVTSSEIDRSDTASVVPTDILEPIDAGTGKYFLHTPKEATFETLTRERNWYRLASTKKLYQDLQDPNSARIPAMAVLFHMRLTRPILGMILVLMGLSVILRDHNRNVFISAGMCLVLCAVFFAAIFAGKQLGENDIVPPALAAWLPVLFFGPISLAMFDAVHT
jgi:lipopolysaccharide export system permease protein